MRIVATCDATVGAPVIPTGDSTPSAERNRRRSNLPSSAAIAKLAACRTAHRTIAKPTRMVTEEARARIEHFFLLYGMALDQGRASLVSECWETSAFVMSDDCAKAVTSTSELETYFAAAIDWYRSQGLVRLRPYLEKVESLGERLFSVDVTWHASDAHGIERSAERTRYTLRLDAEDQLRIRVSVAVSSF